MDPSLSLSLPPKKRLVKIDARALVFAVARDFPFVLVPQQMDQWMRNITGFLINTCHNPRLTRGLRWRILMVAGVCLRDKDRISRRRVVSQEKIVLFVWWEVLIC